MHMPEPPYANTPRSLALSMRTLIENRAWSTPSAVRRRDLTEETRTFAQPGGRGFQCQWVGASKNRLNDVRVRCSDRPCVCNMLFVFKSASLEERRLRCIYTGSDGWHRARTYNQRAAGLRVVDRPLSDDEIEAAEDDIRCFGRGRGEAGAA
ncbi:hypothetical protein BD311DRAFT_441844 [Dichomitus squalens]|uniref:Uncharacterized protein n=1 Tax=Dichomitus squalens TaxID=114155 RepID=A0A4Q9N0E3_9APHY|nr:hypothetical protein BD311DRAFT_441844 [Dichomitus squalens]